MLEIFTLKTTTWRIIQGIYSGIRMGGHRQGIFLDEPCIDWGCEKVAMLEWI
jgi:hypothetical protein